MLTGLLEGLLLLLSPAPLLYFAIGVVIGLLIGSLPGLGGIATLALLIPFLFGMDPVPGLAFILGAYGAVSFGGAITSILANTPGTSEQVVTTFDGYPMARRGEADRALRIAATASAFGGMFGVLMLVIAIPFARQIIIYMRPPEIFALGMLGILILGVMDSRTPLRGVASGCLGLMISFIGLDPVTGVRRMTFDQLWLYDGFGLATLVIGLFAIGEMLRVYIQGSSIAGSLNVSEEEQDAADVVANQEKRWYRGIDDVLKNWKLTVQCSTIGGAFGMLPGIGATVAMFFTYGWAKKRSKTPELFGKGAPEGVMGPESANNAKEGGSLLPTMAFGIPGSSGMALMIGVFLFFGYVPGPDMMTNNLDIVFLVAWVIALSNAFAAVVGMGFVPLLAKATHVRATILAPLLITVSLMGAFVEKRTGIAMVIALLAGILGYTMKSLGYSTAGLVLGFVLGPIIERNLALSLQAYGPGFFTRPITAGLLLAALFAVLLPRVKAVVARKASEQLKDEAAPPGDSRGKTS